MVVTFLWVALLVLLWVGVVGGIWAMLSASDEYPTEVSQPTPEE
jgi:hypothetical protein